MELEPLGKKRQRQSEIIARTKANEKQWYLIDMAIKAFISKYSFHWQIFQDQLSAERTKYNLAQEGDLKKANWRNVASFPVIYNNQSKEIDSILPVLEKIIPKLTHKKSVNLKPFLKKYKCFQTAEKF